MEYPIIIHLESGRKWLVVKEEAKPDWWQRWSNDRNVYVPIDSPLLKFTISGIQKEKYL